MNDAFISYRREGGYLMAQLLKNTLKDEGIYCYLDLEEDRSGDFDERLFKAIRESSSFILILTKETLANCIYEDSWVRKEIVEAVRCDKKIIPVIYHDFSWPKELNGQLPAEVLSLETKQGVVFSKEYLKSTVEKIAEYINDAERVNNKSTKSDFLKDGTKDFFINGFDGLSAVQCVDMAFHAGADWQRNSDKLEILNDIINKNITLRILVNSADTVSNICSHMSQPLRRYVGFDNSVKEWIELAQMYPDVVYVHIADVPLMHRLYILRGENTGVANVKYYTYGNCIPDKDFRAVFDNSDAEYNLYVAEFDYIWDKASHSAV